MRFPGSQNGKLHTTAINYPVMSPARSLIWITHIAGVTLTVTMTRQPRMDKSFLLIYIPSTGSCISSYLSFKYDPLTLPPQHVVNKNKHGNAHTHIRLHTSRAVLSLTLAMSLLPFSARRYVGESLDPCQMDIRYASDYHRFVNCGCNERPDEWGRRRVRVKRG